MAFSLRTLLLFGILIIIANINGEPRRKTAERQKRFFFWNFPIARPRPKPSTSQPYVGSTALGKTCSCATRFRREETDESTPGNNDNLTDSWRIVGGEPTKPHAYKQIAYILYDGRTMCGGTILNNQYIVTAAHCMDNDAQASKFKVSVGAYDLSKTETSRKTFSVKRVIPHPNYNSRTFENDIGLLELSTPIKFDSNIRPTCLPREDDSYSGKTGIAVGWGRTSESGSSSKILREVEVPIISNSVCQNYYRGFTIYAKMMCAGYRNGGKDSCAGDSGGPLFYKSSTFSQVLQVGVTSFGEGCARRERPGVYSRITDYKDSFLRQSAKTSDCTVYVDPE